MAYVQERKKEVEVEFSLESIWAAIPQAASELDWEILEKDDVKHELIVKAGQVLTSYPTCLRVILTPENEKLTNLCITGETPVTTITATLDFSQTFDCIDFFLFTLAEILNKP